MLCQNCKKNEANVKYTEIINGEKKVLMLCEECSHELGIDNINFNMPIDFSSFFGGLLEEGYDENRLMPVFGEVKTLKCDNCNMTYDEFINKGKFGCPNCYDVFSKRIDSILRRIHGSSEYLGRKTIDNEAKKEKIKTTNKKDTKKDEEEKLQEELKKAIEEERYEDAAILRDKINNLKK